MTALLSRVISHQRERGLYMGMQQTYGGVARIIAPLFFGWSFDTLGVSSPYFFASAFIVATILLGLGLDKYAEARRAEGGNYRGCGTQRKLNRRSPPLRRRNHSFRLSMPVNFQPVRVWLKW